MKTADVAALLGCDPQRVLRIAETLDLPHGPTGHPADFTAAQTAAIYVASRLCADPARRGAGGHGGRLLAATVAARYAAWAEGDTTPPMWAGAALGPDGCSVALGDTVEAVWVALGPQTVHDRIVRIVPLEAVAMSVAREREARRSARDHWTVRVEEKDWVVTCGLTRRIISADSQRGARDKFMHQVARPEAIELASHEITVRLATEAELAELHPQRTPTPPDTIPLFTL